MNIGTGSGNEPKITLRIPHPGDSSHNIQRPRSRLPGEINNINGSLLLQSEGTVVVYGDINVGESTIVGGKFVQNYIDTVYNTGGEPEYLWQGPVGIAEGLLVNYYGSYSGLYSMFNETMANSVNVARGAEPESKIVADKVYISARFLNINGLIQAGRDYTVTLGDVAKNQINNYRRASIKSMNYLDNPLQTQENDYTAYWDNKTNSIISRI